MTFIDPRAKALRHIDRIAAWDRGEKPAPVTVEWDLSNRCVLGCQDCHFAHTHVRGPWAMKARTLPMAFDGTGDLADTGLVLRTLDDLHAAGVRAIVWSGGGEPTTHPEWLTIIQYAQLRGFEQGMYTCGGLLTPESAKTAASLLSWVVVSLDAADAETYAHEKGVPTARFDAACAGLAALTGGKATVGASFLLHAENWHRTDDMLALARDLGATYTTFRPAIQTAAHAPGMVMGSTEWVLEALPDLVNLESEPDVELDAERFVAYAGWQGHGYSQCRGITLNTTITPDGRVWLCPQRRGVSALGDLRRESFADIWARHPKSFTVDAGCRVMCRLHPVNGVLDALQTPRAHEAFV